jgi:hypothetical protein
MTQSEGHIKYFLKRVKAATTTHTTDSFAKENQTALIQLASQVNKLNFSKEKLLVCCNLMQKRLKQPDDKLDKKKGIQFDRLTIGKLTTEEKAMILRQGKQLTPAYFKYIHKEEWYQKIKRKNPVFKREKKIFPKELSKALMWYRIREHCVSLIDQLAERFP